VNTTESTSALIHKLAYLRATHRKNDKVKLEALLEESRKAADDIAKDLDAILVRELEIEKAERALVQRGINADALIKHLNAQVERFEAGAGTHESEQEGHRQPDQLADVANAGRRTENGEDAGTNSDDQPSSRSRSGLFQGMAIHFGSQVNILSKALMPPSGPDRDTYIETVAKRLIADNPGGDDSYFVDKGRATLAGFIHYIVAKVNDAANYSGIPDDWKGKEASIPMLANWIARAKLNGAFAGEAKINARLWSLVDETNPANKQPDEGLGTSTRAFVEFSSLISMAEKERSGILETISRAMNSFKNQARLEPTSAAADAGVNDAVSAVEPPPSDPLHNDDRQSPPSQRFAMPSAADPVEQDYGSPFRSVQMLNVDPDAYSHVEDDHSDDMTEPAPGLRKPISEQERDRMFDSYQAMDAKPTKMPFRSLAEQ